MSTWWFGGDTPPVAPLFAWEGVTDESPLSGDGFLVVTKVGATMPVSAEVWPVHVETDRERAYRLSLAREEYRARRAAEQQAYADLWSDLLALADVDAVQSSPVVNAVLQLHAPELSYGTLSCASCWDGDMDRMPWPCQTVETIAGAYGIVVPELIR